MNFSIFYVKENVFEFGFNKICYDLWTLSCVQYRGYVQWWKYFIELSCKNMFFKHGNWYNKHNLLSQNAYDIYHI